MTADGIVEFATIYPGWYHGRAVHIHLRVHHAGDTMLTSQLFFPDGYTDAVYPGAPYAQFGNPDTTNAQDSIAGDPVAEGTMLTVHRRDRERPGHARSAQPRGGGLMDLTQAATPGYFATMAIEHQVLKHRAVRVGPSPADYERKDTRTSLGMGVLSLVAPFVAAKVLAPFVPGKGKYGKALVATAAGATLVTTVADRFAAQQEPEPRTPRAGQSGAVAARPTRGRWRR